MKLILVDNGEYTAVYHDFYKNKLGVYKTSDGTEGLMELIGVRITKNIFCPDASKGHLVDATDGFPTHIDNLPKAERTVVHKEPSKKEPKEETTKKADGGPQKAGRKARRPSTRKK